MSAGYTSFHSTGIFSRQEPPIRVFDDPDVGKRILACTGIENPENYNQLSAVEARALPNRRLVAAFHIDNAFTTTDDDYRRHFQTVADQKLSRLSENAWEQIANLTHGLVRKEIGETGPKQYEIYLVPLVQLVSLKMILHALFGHDPLKLEDSVIAALARNINELWIQSKESCASGKKIQPLQLATEKALIAVFPDGKLTSRETPMNLILPAYETLWRVLLRCFLEVSFRNRMADLAWRPVLTNFLAKPTYAQFEADSSELNSVSISFIVLEALRLYPPTRRVYRTFQLAGSLKKETIAADIEHCQRNPTIWGEESLKFVPMRWKNLGEKARKAFMPFGEISFQLPLVGHPGKFSDILQILEAESSSTKARCAATYNRPLISSWISKATMTRSVSLV